VVDAYGLDFAEALAFSAVMLGAHTALCVIGYGAILFVLGRKRKRP
jgi:uncharacterized protein (DUF2062 family)